MQNIFTIIGNALLYILKAPNWIWSLPFLKNLKGLRLMLMTALTAILTLTTAIDWPVISNLVCQIWHLIKPSAICDPAAIQLWITAFMAWAAGALKIEDLQEKKAAGLNMLTKNN